MTTEALSPPRVAARGALSRAFAGHAGPLAVVCLALLVLWYLGAVWLNAPVLIDGYERRDTDWSLARLAGDAMRSEEHTSELQSLMRNTYAVFCLKKKKNN